MPVKFTMHFSMGTTPNESSPVARVAGWSESMWLDGMNLATAKETIKPRPPATSILSRRLELLPSTGFMTHYTIQAYNFEGVDLVPRGAAEEVTVGKVGARDLPNDIPQMALHCRAGFVGGHPQARSFHLRGIPDQFVEFGAATFNIDYRAAIRTYFNAMGGSFGAVIDNRRDNQQMPIVTVTDAGVLTALAADVPPGVGDFVKVLRTTDENNRRVGGTFRVSARDVPNLKFTLEGWSPIGPTRGGTMVKVARTWAAFDPARISFVRVSPRKVGSAPGKYRGRRKPRLA